MRVTRVKFTNYRKHKSLDLELTGNLIGITGRNGSGKSRLLIGIRDCLTGEFSPTKEKCVTWGQEEGSLEVDVQLSSTRRMTVHRDIPSGKAWIKFDGEEKASVTGPAKVNERVLQELSTEKSILTNIVFVGQKDIETLLFDRSGIKARLAQRFFGLDKAAILEKALGTEQAKVSFDSMEAQIPALTEEINRVRAQLQTHNDALAHLGERVTQEQVAAVEKQWREASDFTNREVGLRSLAIAAEQLQTQINEGNAQIHLEEQALAQVNVQQLDQLYGYHLQVQQQQSQQRGIMDGIARLEASIAAAGAEPFSEAEDARLTAECQRIDGLIDLKSWEIRQLRQEIHNSIATPNCPKCGQPIDLSHRQRMESDLARREAELTDLIDNHQTPARTAFQAVAGPRTIWKTKIGNSPAQIEILRQQLVALGEVPAIVPEPQKFLDARRKIDALSANLAARKQQIASAQAMLTQNLQQQEAARQALTSGQSPGDPQALIRELDGLRVRQAAQSQELAHIQHVQAALDRAAGQLQMARDAARENFINKEYQKALDRLREVFHPDGAPKVLVSRTVQRLEEGINRYLELLDLPFRAKAREGLEFDYTFEAGLGDADDLSVGQQVDMSWAFRLAAMQTLGASVGMMTMDEPTAPLDKETKKHFNLLLDHLRQMATAGHVQFIVATHDEDLVAFCDQHIQL